MTVAIEEVPMWIIWHGIGHVVGRGVSTDAWYTICGHMMCAPMQSEIPKRICKKCRAKLKEAETTLIN